MDNQAIDFDRLRKNLRRNISDGPGVIRIAVLMDSASQLVVQAIQGYGIEFSVRFDIFEADYDQIDRQVFDRTSDLYRFSPDFVVIIRSTERLLKTFYKGSPGQGCVFAEEQSAYTDSLYNSLTGDLKTKVIFGNFPELDDAVFGNFANKTSASFLYQLRKLNCLLMEKAQTRPDLFICDIAALVSAKGKAYCFDPKLYVAADMVFSLDFLPLLAKALFDIIQAIKGVVKKCLILDLDNTIWGGIIGDDGLEGIEIGQLGSGKIFTGIQLWAKQLVKRGIIVAVCSKNTEEIAKSPFLEHPEMELRLEDIAVFAANWENKVDNIRYIKEVLNIGFDSMVFLDDNPFEREMVSQAIPEVTVPSLPGDPAEYLSYIRQLNLFETASFTGEDIERTRQYQDEAKRAEVQRSFTNEEGFLESLGMKSEAMPFDEYTIPRIAQLSQRSNQFNLRTVRYVETDVRLLSGDPDCVTLSLTLRDNFGDYGLIAYVVGKKLDEKTLFIENWVMSCRVLKRGMERFTLSCIQEIALGKGYDRLVGEYIPTKKNRLVENHYRDLGFSAEDGNRWSLVLSKDAETAPCYIQKL